MADTNAMKAALEGWVGERRGAASDVVEFRQLTAGHSRAMWYLELADGERLVVRIEQGGVFGISGAQEYRFMEAALQLGFPVATVRWSEPTGDVIGQPFFVMDFLPCATAEREDRTLPASVAEDFVRQLHGLHETPWDGVLMTDTAPADATHAHIDRWAAVYRASTPIPIPLLEEGAVWLHRHAPALQRSSIVHGDPGPGNFVHDGVGVVAFTDWEFAHLGDPMEDWAYVIGMRGMRSMPREAWRTLFREIAGVEVTDADLRYWGAFGYFKGACANLSCLGAFAGANPTPNMAIIGTALQQTFMRQLADLVLGSERGRASGRRVDVAR